MNDKADMRSSRKLEREIAVFVDQCRQKDAAKQAAKYTSPGTRGTLYDNSLWTHLFFESSSLNAAGYNKADRAKDLFRYE